MEIKPGSKWKDRDPREGRGGRTVTVDRVDGDAVFVTSNRGVKSKIARKRFGEQTSKGFDLVEEAAAQPQA